MHLQLLFGQMELMISTDQFQEDGLRDEKQVEESKRDGKNLLTGNDVD